MTLCKPRVGALDSKAPQPLIISADRPARKSVSPDGDTSCGTPGAS